jgi:hypothetical protein
MAWLRLITLLLPLLVLPFGTAAAESNVVVEVEGTAEIGRGGVWTAATSGAAVREGDELRTGSQGRMLILFDDGSVVVVGKDSRLTIDEHLFEPSGTVRSLLHLMQGRIRALVSEAFEGAGAVYEIETPTSVASVRGTEFVVHYDPVAGATDIVGVTGEVEVYSALSWTKGAVILKPRELTRIERGKFPTLPRALPDRLFLQYLEGLDLFVGGGQGVSLATGHPLLTGRSVPSEDRARAVPGPSAAFTGVPVDLPYERQNRGSVADVTIQPPIPALLPPTGGIGVDF